MPVLDVPYFVQPDSTHCQATCLKMMSTYLDAQIARPPTPRDIFVIKKTINESAARPDKNAKNSWTNMKWWLDSEFKSKFSFDLFIRTDAAEAHARIVDSVRDRLPVMVSTQHGTINGHVIMVVGVKVEMGSNLYSDNIVGAVRERSVYVCHDPYGAADPAGRQPLRYGSNRFIGGVSLMVAGKGEVAPGRNVHYPPDNIRKVVNSAAGPETYYILLRPQRKAA